MCIRDSFKTNTSFNIANTSSQEDFDDDYILIYKDINNILDDIAKLLNIVTRDIIEKDREKSKAVISITMVNAASG